MSQPNQNRHLPDLIKKHYCLNCCVHLLERFRLLMYLYNRDYKDIAVRFCFWWYLQWCHQTAHYLLQWAEGTSYHDSFLRSHLFLHSRSWFLPVLFVQHIQSEKTHKTWGICEKKQWIIRCFFCSVHFLPELEKADIPISISITLFLDICKMCLSAHLWPSISALLDRVWNLTSKTNCCHTRTTNWFYHVHHKHFQKSFWKCMWKH